MTVYDLLEAEAKSGDEGSSLDVVAIATAQGVVPGGAA
jgi:hypothetical protein